MNNNRLQDSREGKISNSNKIKGTKQLEKGRVKRVKEPGKARENTKNNA